jgi:hypothetical protein
LEVIDPDRKRAGQRRNWIVDEIRRYRNFAPFVRQTGERKAQTCAMAMLRQQYGLH